MLDQQAELHATDPLEALADAIAGLSGQVAGQLEDTEAEFMPRFRRLQRAQQAAGEAVRAAEEAVARAEEADERRAAEAWLEDAEEAQRRLDAAMDDVQSALARYKAEARELDCARRGIFPEAARHLQTLVANAKAYSAVAVPSGAGGGDTSTGGGSTAPPPIEALDLSAITLPPGMEWIPIAGIAPDQFIAPDGNSAKGVTRETMERGMWLFYADLVPILRENPGVTRDELAEMDRARGTLWTAEGFVHPDSLANLGDIFLFGDDVIAAEPDAAGRYRFSSGRHHATVARDLGMSHVPAREQHDARGRSLDTAVRDMIRRSEDRTKGPNSHSDYWVSKGDLISDFDVLKRLCGCPTTENRNGSLSVHYAGRTFTMYHSETGPLAIEIHGEKSKLAKFRYHRF